MALNTSDVVAALDMVKVYIPIWEYVKETGPRYFEYDVEEAQ